ncbi:AraC family transcriptional regulator, partial [Pseudomonas sp. KHB2.9]
MSSPEPKPVPLDAEMEKQRAELASIVRRHTWEDGSYGTAITSLFLNRHNTPRDFSPVLVEPALCILANGRKEVRLADEIFAYDPLNYLVFSVSMPVAGRIIDATAQDPNLSIRINI